MMPQPLQSTSIARLETLKSALFVFALDIESASEFHHVNRLITGAGKVNASYELTKAIHYQQPKLIVNLGSAGSNFFKRGEVVCCTQFIQRDMDAQGLGFKPYETPFSGSDPLLKYGIRIEELPEGICGTGDNFETAHLSSDYSVIDMEAYSLALVASRENIPFLCLKYISDGADGAAAADWMIQVHLAATAFKNILFPNG
ncbi:MAG: 5'-methylthioadenosine/S-adenosylhomocysteine nucleosidase family protein [Flavisolibacter sp.]